MAFHHRHLPTFTRFTKLIVWKWMHLYWPMMIHYLTDKYEGRIHHLIVDTIYAVISFVLVATNIGLGIWFYLYFTPADVNVQMNVDARVQSGEVTTIHVQYANYGRPVHDAHLQIRLPEGFVVGNVAEDHAVVDVQLGNLPSFSTGSLQISGIVYGNIHDVYTYDADIVYTTVGRQERREIASRFYISDSAFSATLETSRASTYDIPTTLRVHYQNTGDGTFDAARLVFDLPEYFTVDSISLNGVAQNQFSDSRAFALGKIEPHSSGELDITGTFRGSGEQFDQSLQIRMTPFISVRVAEDRVAEFQYAEQYATIQLIHPYMNISVTGSSAYTYGDTTRFVTRVKNESQTEIQHVALKGYVLGKALLNHSIRIDGVFAARDAEGYVLFPEIDVLAPGEERQFTVTVPSQYTDAAYQYGTLRVFGDAYAPMIEKSFDAYEDGFATRFASRISIASQALYYGPTGEALGYGPNPPIAWNVTAYRVFLRIDNGNQPVTSVVLKTTLPGMTTWTGSYSTSIGSMHYDATSRTVSWTISELPADAKNLGAQFEVRFLPNHLQVGLRPHIINDLSATAFDPFAGITTSAFRGAISSAAILP